MADLDLTNFQGFLDYEGLEYYDDKSETRTDEKIAVETERATNAEKTLTTNLNTHTSNKSNPHGVTKSQVGLGNVDNTSDVNKPISTATQTALDKKANIASPTLTGTPKAPTATSGTNTTQIATTAFVQTEIGNLINGAPETANTLKELSDLIEEHQDVTDALNAAIGTKANASDLTSHTGNTTVHITSTERTNWNDANSKKHTHSNKTILDETTASFTTAEKEKLAGIASGANKYSLPSAGSSLGGVKTGGDVTISSGVITVNDDSHNHVISNVDGLQDALDGKAASSHTHSSYANQNAFSNVKVGSTTIAADTTTDTLTLAGSNVTITPDATNDKVTIGITKDNVIAALGYTPPTTNTTYSTFVKSGSGAKAGLVPAPSTTTGSTKYLCENGTWAVPATSYTLPTASSTLGGVKTTSTVTSTSGLTACPIINGVVYYKDTSTTYTHPTSGVTAGTYRSVTVDANGHVTAGSNPTITVAQGGTGKTTLTSGYALIGNGTSAVSLRAITSTPSSGSTSLFTAGGAYTQLATKLNTSAVVTSLDSTSTTNALAASAGKNLQDQITALNSDLVIKEYYAPSTKGVIEWVSYPNGLNFDNCMIVGFRIYHSEYSYWYNDGTAITIINSHVGSLGLYVDSDGFLGQKIQIVFKKINQIIHV